MFIVISFNFSYFFLLFNFTQCWNSTTSSLSLNYLYSLFFCFKKIKNVIFYLNSNKRKLCSSNCTPFFNIYTFSNVSPSLYLFIPNILPWYHSSSFLLSSFILILFIIILSVKICHSLFHLYIIFFKKNSGYFPLFLPHFFGGFLFLFFLHLYFSLIKFCIL